MGKPRKAPAAAKKARSARVEPRPRAGRGKAEEARGRTRLEVDARRAQLVELGLVLFSERSYDEVSIDDLARAAGISKGLLYHYFPTKRDFYVAAIREAARRLLDSTLMSEELPPLERLRAGLEAYLAYVERHGPAYSALLRGGIGSDPEIAGIVEATRGTFLERLLEGVPGAPRGPLLRAALLGFIGFVEQMSLDWVERRDLDRGTVRDYLAELLPRALELTGLVIVPR